MKRMWTPWRMRYIKEPKEEGCIFCNKINAGVSKDRENLVLERGKRAFIVLNLYPYANGHMMVAPYDHTGDLELLEGETLEEMMLLVSKGIRALRATSKPQGFNIGVNMGRIAGAGEEKHVHIHIVPRWGGDTNFMPVLANVRMIPELLRQTYDRLLDAFNADIQPKKTPMKNRRRKER